MDAKRLSPDEFFKELASLFEAKQKKDEGSVFLVQKRLSYGLDKEKGDELSTGNILIRATTGAPKGSKSKPKFSTVLRPEDLEDFYSRYAEVCKSGMQGMKKRDRSGRKKAKAKKRKEAAPVTSN